MRIVHAIDCLHVVIREPTDRVLKISWFAAAVLLALSAGGAWAQEDKKTDDEKPADPDTGESTVEESTLGLLPNPLQKYGIKFAATYIGETQGNVSGGLRQGAVYDGRLNLAIDVDLQKLAGLRELIFHANMFQIHGDGLSRSNLQNFLVVSGIEALPSTRLYEIWFEQKWGDKLALRAGQLAADTEFINAKYTDVFTNSSLGWPAITAINLPSGGRLDEITEGIELKISGQYAGDLSPQGCANGDDRRADAEREIGRRDIRTILAKTAESFEKVADRRRNDVGNEG